MMTTRTTPRIGLATTSICLSLGLLALATIPVRAGEILCSLQATVGGGSATEVQVGEEVLIEGSGFPTGDVEVSFSVEGTFLRSVTASADATGFFEVSDVPQPGEEGLWSVEAIGIDEICTATTGYMVVSPPASPSPLPSASAAASVAASPAPAVSTIPNVAAPSDRAPVSLAVFAGFGLLIVALAALLVGRRTSLR